MFEDQLRSLVDELLFSLAFARMAGFIIDSRLNKVLGSEWAALQHAPTRQHRRVDLRQPQDSESRVPQSVVDELQHYNVRAWAACGSLE